MVRCGVYVVIRCMAWCGVCGVGVIGDVWKVYRIRSWVSGGIKVFGLHRRPFPLPHKTLAVYVRPTSVQSTFLAFPKGSRRHRLLWEAEAGREHGLGCSSSTSQGFLVASGAALDR